MLLIAAMMIALLIALGRGLVAGSESGRLRKREQDCKQNDSRHRNLRRKNRPGDDTPERFYGKANVLVADAHAANNPMPMVPVMAHLDPAMAMMVVPVVMVMPSIIGPNDDAGSLGRSARNSDTAKSKHSCNQ